MGIEPFFGQIQAFAGPFAPRGWEFCYGQTLAISENQALFAVIGTRYGGNGTTTFCLPDLRGRAIVGAGQGPALRNQELGVAGGAQSVALGTSELAAHGHGVQASASLQCRAVGSKGAAAAPSPGAFLAASFNPDFNAEVNWYSTSGDQLVELSGVSVQATGTANNSGGTDEHDNRQPWCAINYIIAVDGVWPQRP